jgi:hypothetical protein
MTKPRRRTNETIRFASALELVGFKLTGIQISTPDGRDWQIAPVGEGRGRHADGHWGPVPGPGGGYRLFEVDHDEGTLDEHDPVEENVWYPSDLVDYLKAIGQPKPPRPTPNPTPNSNSKPTP